MSRASAASLAALLLCGHCLLAQARAAEQPDPAAPAPPATAAPDFQAGLDRIAGSRRDAEQAIRRKLQSRETITFQGRPLGAALDDLAERGEFTIHVEATSLVEEGIRTDTPVSGEFKEATVEQILNRVLAPLALAWFVEDEVLKVTTQTRANETFFTRTYNVGRLLRLAERRRREARRVGANGPLPPTSDVQFIGVGNGETGPGPGPLEPQWTWLHQMVYEHTSGEWEVIDQVGGSLELIGDSLVVRQTYHVQDEIAALLAAVGRALGGEAEGRSLAVPASPTLPAGDDAAVVEALAGKVTLHRDKAPFGEFMADVAKTAGVPVIIDEAALQEEGIATEDPVGVTVEDATLASALRIAGAHLGLAFHPEQGALAVTTETRANEAFFNVIYDATDVAEAPATHRRLVQAILDANSGEWEFRDQVGGALASLAPGLFVVRQTFRSHGEIAELLDRLRRTAKAEDGARAATDDAPEGEEVIRFYMLASAEEAASAAGALKSMVAPDAWKAEGEHARIRIVGPTLVVRHTPEIQQAVAEFLRGLTTAQPPGTPQPGHSGFGTGCGYGFF